ncbi:hypothetical protein BGZ51_009868, partial [Haplosporangium sp. Z 767]
MFDLAWRQQQTGQQLLDAFNQPDVELSKSGHSPKKKAAFKEVKAFVETLKSLLKWLDTCHHQEHDTTFTSWITEKLLSTPGIMDHRFSAAFSTSMEGHYRLNVSQLERLAGENWIDDEILNQMAQYLDLRYKDGNQQIP